jgi:hypothetical protein
LVSLWSKSHYRPGRERSAPGLHGARADASRVTSGRRPVQASTRTASVNAAAAIRLAAAEP